MDLINFDKTEASFSEVAKLEDIAGKNTQDSVKQLNNLVAKYLWNV